MEDYAVPLPVTVICELSGAGRRSQRFRRWSRAIVSSVPPDVAQESTRSVSAYLTALIDAKRVSPSDDLLSEPHPPVSVWHAVARRSRPDGLLLLVAGLEKMVGLIGNGVLALLQHPVSWPGCG